jgi:hypothetical protein
LKAVSTIRHAREGGHPGIKHLMEVIWIPASAGMTKDAIHPRFGKRGILAYFRKATPPERPDLNSSTDLAEGWRQRGDFYVGL